MNEAKQTIDPQQLNEAIKEAETEVVKDLTAKQVNWAWWIVWSGKVLMFLLVGGAGAGVTWYATRPTEEPPIVADITVKDVSGDPGTLIFLTAETSGKSVRWRSLDPALNVLSNLPDLVARKQAAAISCKPGTYCVECWSAISDVPTAIYLARVTIGTPNPPMPVPPSPPAPIPPAPVPPAPTPVPPGPPSALTARLQSCYAADPTSRATKVAQKTALLGLYEAMADHARSTKLLTTEDLLSDLKLVAYGDGKTPGMIRQDVMVECRKIISTEVLTALGTDIETKLDPDMRQKAVDVFARIAKALSEIK